MSARARRYGIVPGRFGFAGEAAGIAPAGGIGLPQERPRRGTTKHSAEVKTERKSLPWPVFLFLVSLLLPWIITIGPFRLSAYRLVLIASILPCLMMWINGQAGKLRVADFALLFYCAWCFIAISIIHGVAYAMQPAGMIFLETVGAYMLARCFVRDADDFYNVVLMLFRIVLALLPFAIFEAVTGRNIAREILASIYHTFPDAQMDPRWGLRRVQTVFEHPILYGVFCASVLTLAYLVLGYGRSVIRQLIFPAIVGAAAFLSLSAGPLTAVVAQAILLAWNWLLKSVDARWKILCGLVLMAIIFAEFMSKRSLPAIFISYFAFDEQSAWMRLNIWHYGTASALNNPLFGVGFNEWPRASWMGSSIDMFWIIDAVRHGIPAEFLMILAFFAVYLPVVLKTGLPERLSVYRTAFIISMTGFFIVGWTVYLWNATYVLFLFLLGTGVWLLDQKADPHSLRRRGHGTVAAPEYAKHQGMR